MQQFRIVPEINICDSCEEFCREFNIGEGDLFLTNPTYFEKSMKKYAGGASAVYLKEFGTGEPKDTMAEALFRKISGINFRRLIAVGGGSIIDLAKLMVQENILPVEDLYDKKIPTHKIRELIIVPTTCGTGSEVTSVSVIELTARKTKLGLQTDEEFADKAVLIPELLEDLPARFFGTSSIDALIHSFESYMSPKATDFSMLFSEKAMSLILNGYRKIVSTQNVSGADEMAGQIRKEHMKEFLTASTFAGIAFGNAGCAAVHAMSMPLSAAHHVAHGEANYVIFTGVFRAYNALKPEGRIKDLNMLLSGMLECSVSEVYDKLEALLSVILPKKTLSEYGVTDDELKLYTDVVMTKQGRLTANNYVPLDEKEVMRIYRSLM